MKRVQQTISVVVHAVTAQGEKWSLEYESDDKDEVLRAIGMFVTRTGVLPSKDSKDSTAIRE